MIQPLDLKTILVNYLSGSFEIFFYIAMIGFVLLAAKFRMPSFAIALMITLFVSIYSVQYSALFALVVLIIGVFLALVLTRAIKF